MLKLVAKFTIKEGREDEFIKVASKLAEETRKEAGCIVYELFQDINNKSILTFIEEWKDKDAHTFHVNTPHFKEAGPKFDELREAIEVNFYKLIK